MEFGFNSKTDFMDYIELEDFYNVGLEAIDTDGYAYYLLIRTSQGDYTALEWGPVSIDNELLPSEFNVSFARGESGDKALIKKISAFLGPKKRTKTAKDNSPNKSKFAKIIEVNNIGINEVLNYRIDVFKYIESYSKDSNF